MAGRDPGMEDGDEDATMMVPPCDRDSGVHAAVTERWEETTQVDEPCDAETRDAHPAMTFALPAPFEEDSDDELTDFAVIIEVPTPPARHEDLPTPPVFHEHLPAVPALQEHMPTPPLLPRSALPAALPVRAKLGTTPPPKLQAEARANITWREQAQEESAETQEARAETQEAPRPARLELQEPIPQTRPTLAAPPRFSRTLLVALACAALAIGALSAALLVNQEHESAEPVATTKVVSIPIFIPVQEMEAGNDDALLGLKTKGFAPSDEAKKVAKDHLAKGAAALALQDYLSAELSLRRALQRDASLDEAVRLLGVVYERQGKSARALHWYGRYLGRAPQGTHAQGVLDAIVRIRGDEVQSRR